MLHPLLVMDLVADDAAYGSTADGAERTATSENCAADGADTGTHSGILVALGHIATSAKGRNACYSQYA